jgi:hypothetical protein
LLTARRSPRWGISKILNVLAKARVFSSTTTQPTFVPSMTLGNARVLQKLMHLKAHTNLGYIKRTGLL